MSTTEKSPYDCGITETTTVAKAIELITQKFNIISIQEKNTFNAIKAAMHLMQFLPVVDGGVSDICEIESNHRWVLAGSDMSGVVYYIGFTVTTNGVSVVGHTTKSGVSTGFFTFHEDILSQPLKSTPRFSSFIAIAYAIINVSSRIGAREWRVAPPPYAIHKQPDGQYRRR